MSQKEINNIVDTDSIIELENYIDTADGEEKVKFDVYYEIEILSDKHVSGRPNHPELKTFEAALNLARSEKIKKSDITGFNWSKFINLTANIDSDCFFSKKIEVMCVRLELARNCFYFEDCSQSKKKLKKDK